MVWPFIRKHSVRIVIGLVLVLVVYGALLVWVPYQREQRIAKEIVAFGGEVAWEYAGPDWIPQSVRDRTMILSRVTELSLISTKVTDADLEHLKGLTNLTHLELDHTKVTDAGLEHLNGLTNLDWLDLFGTHVTGAGMQHLKGLTKLIFLDLTSTQVTPEGRAMIRKALPNCEIAPDL